MKEKYLPPCIHLAEELRISSLLESLSLEGNIDNIELGEDLSSTTNF